MSKKLDFGDSNGIARKVSKLMYGDANGIARKCKLYYGDPNGIARQIIGGGNPYPIPLTETQVELLKGAYNLNNQSLVDIQWNQYYQQESFYNSSNSIIVVGTNVNQYNSICATNDVAYFIDTNTYVVSLWNSALTANISETSFDFSPIVDNAGRNPGRMRVRADYQQTQIEGLSYILTHYTNQNTLISGSFNARESTYFNTYASSHNLSSDLAFLWGSKNVPIYIGDSIANAKLLPDPSSL